MKIEISSEVYEYLSKHVTFTHNTPDAVLRKLLHIGETVQSVEIADEKVLLWCKGVPFPEGMKLRMKNNPNEIAVVKDGVIIYKGSGYDSPSGAAIAANNGISTNGWIYWEFWKEDDKRWYLVDSLRKKM